MNRIKKDLSSIDKKELRLQVYLSQAGVGSRRQCEKWIDQRRVKINGTLVSRQGLKVQSSDSVLFNNVLVSPKKENLYLAFHKPTQYLCSTRDPMNRSLIYDILPESFKKEVFYVGRLDYMSSGLLLLTSDGGFSRKITLPQNGIEKEYVVTTSKPISQEMLIRFKKGLRLQNEILQLKKFEYIHPRKVKLTLEEGKNRELRRVFEFFHIRIKKVHRTRLGNITLDSIRPGYFRKLSNKELQFFEDK